MLSKYVKEIRHRIRKKKFLKEIRISHECGVMSDWLAKKFITMTDKIGNGHRYAEYSYLEDMKAHAVLQLMKSWTKFNPDKCDNANAYFTTVIHCAFSYYLNKENREWRIKTELQNMVDDEQHF